MNRVYGPRVPQAIVLRTRSPERVPIVERRPVDVIAGTSWLDATAPT